MSIQACYCENFLVNCHFPPSLQIFYLLNDLLCMLLASYIATMRRVSSYCIIIITYSLLNMVSGCVHDCLQPIMIL